ncbi:TPA: ribosome-recycling factor [Patescibacteria group bacterium]|nr:ribosome-recycling factor [Candidatus Gracilibacteria bacterium]
MMKVPQVGHVTLMDGQTIKIEPWDKNELKHIEKAIYDANTGLTPQNQGSYIMIKIPPLTQERRLDIQKQVKSMGEEIKARIRLVRQDAMKDTKKQFDDKLIGEDQHKANEKNVDSLVKEMNDVIDTHVKSKCDDVMKV